MDEELQALYWAMHNFPPSPTVVNAAKGDLELNLKTREREMTRDERRLAKRYGSVSAEYRREALQRWRTEAGCTPRNDTRSV